VFLKVCSSSALLVEVCGGGCVFVSVVVRDRVNCGFRLGCCTLQLFDFVRVIVDLAIFVVALLVVGDGGWWFIPCCFMYSGLGDFCLV